MKKILLLNFFLLVYFLLPFNLKSQSNDNCETAIFLPNVSNYCSGIAFYSNFGATASGFGLPNCWGATATEDVWFTFTATGTDALISASGTGNGGTMVRPRIAIYTGDCLGTINQLACANGTAGSGTTQLYQGAMTPGTVYLIRISTTGANEGTFELCVNNYTAINAGADCGGAAFLCNDNPISVATLSGGGANADEPESSSCMESSGADEGNSSWYIWTAGTTGPFAFDIFPVNPSDDIDFMVWQLNGTNPCGPRTVLRCNTSACLNANGSTGLSYTDTDITEDPGCDFGENAYCSAINMVAGTTYALLVNNFSAANGFTINFNTSATSGSIRGPLPVITTNTTSICAGSSVIFNGSNSTNVSGGLNWNFVNGGSPTSATGNGPHTVTYSNPGNYTAILTGTDNLGCNKSESIIITVNAIPNPPTVINVSYCQNQTTSALTATGSNLLWYNSATGGTGSSTAPIPSTANIGTTSYFVSQTVSGCESSRAEIVVTVNSGPSVNTINDVTICSGQSVNTITFSGTSGAAFNWINNTTAIGLAASGNGTINSFIALNTGSTVLTGTITVTPSLSGCTGSPITFLINVNPLITPTFIQINPICTGQTLNPLPTISDNGINGVWSPSIDNTQTTTYTFTPATGQCANTAQMTITVNPGIIPAFTQVAPICLGGTLNPLPTTSDNGVTGSWSPALDNTQTTTYTFTPDVVSCVNNVQMTITVNSPPSIQAVNSQTVCANSNSTAVNFISNPSGATINWTNDNSSIGIGSIGAGNINSFSTVNTGNSVQVAIINATPFLSGCTGNLFTFSITVNPTPSLSSITSQTLCAGATTTLISFTTTPINATVNWTNSNSSIGVGISGSGDISSFTTLNNGNSVTTGIFSAIPVLSGCNGIPQTFSINVNPIPLISPIANQTFCSGNVSTAINFNVLPTGSTVTWANSNSTIGLVSNGNGNINPFNTINNGNTVITGIISVNASFNGCNAQIQQFNIDILPTPVITATSNSPVCLNNTINLTGTGGGTYTWQGPAGFTSSSPNPTINNVSINMSGNYTLSVISANNCQSTSIVNVIVSPLPDVTAISNSPVCVGSNINLGADVNNVISFSWAGPLNFSSTSFNLTLQNATELMSGTYTLTVQNANGCLNASITTVTVNPLPLAPIVIPTELCQNTLSNPLFATATSGGTLNWYGTSSTGGTSTSIAPTPLTNTVGLTTYYVSQTFQGCESPRTPLTVNVLPLPVGSLNSIAPKCAPLCEQFILTTSNAINQFQWNMGNGVLNTNNDTINYCYPFAGNYQVSVRITDTSGCFNNLLFPNWVNVQENPIASFISSPSEVTLIDPEIQFQDQSLGDSIVYYGWNFGDQTTTITNQNIINHIYSNLGTYTVTLIVKTNEGCSDTIKGTVEVLEDINVYIPNSFTPNDDNLNEEFFPQGTGISEEKYQMQIYDRWGELIFSTSKLDEHWKGLKSNGSEPVLQDTYIYKIDLQTIKGNKINKIGHVNLIR